jgi:hypothetical protein
LSFIEKGVYELTGAKARVKLLPGFRPIQHTETAIVSLKGKIPPIFLRMTLEEIS